MRICLVDDDSIQLDYLRVILNKWSNKHNVTLEMHFYHSAEEMLFENEESYPYDMVILDIQMGKINGIELAKKIRQTDKNIFIAFVSGIADYVYEGYEVQALRYILKPIKEKKVFELLDYVKAHKGKESKYLVISVYGDKKKINYDDIVYLESMGHYVIFHLDEEEFNCKYTISELYDDLQDTGFVRTHRSYIVNLKHIEKITRTECLLTDGISVPLSRSSYKIVNEKFIDFHKVRGA